MPRRYHFDMPLPAIRETAPPAVYQPQPLAPHDGQPHPVVVQHIHQAPPDRTIARVALGAGMGGGAIAAGVYFGPLLVATLASMAASMAFIALIAAVSGWAVVSVVRSVGGPDGKAAAKNIRKLRNR
ncbi:MAG: hypothetical protein JO362_10735 [Streptomycetaceae bacterium]|nr:hypothetical protein [Streptomycetaceae bacterium]